MLDPVMVRLIAPPINWAGQYLAKQGLSANSVSIGRFVLGVCALPALALNYYGVALVFILLKRLADGLDGAIARATHKTDFDAYLDIVLDFIFYAVVALGFAFAKSENALVVAALIASFIGTGASFLAYAIIAANRGVETEIRGKKSFFYSGALAEGTETILFFVFICLCPNAFVPTSLIFIGMCWVTVGMRIAQAHAAFETSAN